LKLRELDAADDVAVGMAARRIAKRATNNPALSAALKQSQEKPRLSNI
jgi:hypothetical protein